MVKLFRPGTIPGTGILLFGFLVNLLIVFSFYQAKPQFTIKMGSSDDYSYIDGFYAEEKSDLGTYRWSKDQAVALLPPVGSPYDISVVAASYRPNGGALPRFTLDWDSSPLTQTFQSNASPTEYLLKGNASPVFQFDKGSLTFSIPETYRPNGDNRDLGLLVQRVSIQAHSNSFGFVLPPFWTWLALTGGVLALQGYIFVFSTGQFFGPTARRKIIWPGALVALPSILLLLLTLLTPSLILHSGFSVGAGILALALAGFLLRRSAKWGVIGVGLIMALATYGVFYNLFDYFSPLILAVGLIPVVLFYNSRLKITRLNLVLVGCAAIFACEGLLQQRAVHTHDGEFFHYYWLNELDLLVKAGNFYPRWASDFSFGHGSTVFNFYSPLSRYLAEVFVLLRLEPAFAFQAYLCAVTLASGISLYFLAHHLTGPLGAVIAAVAYIYHPYRLAEIYMRGDMAEALNFVFIPLIVLAVLKILAAPGRRSLVPALAGGFALALAIISHQLSAFFFGLFLLAPLLFFNLLSYFFQERRKEGGSSSLAFKKITIKIGWLAVIPGLGLALAAFYILPVIFESNFIQLKNSAGFNPQYSLLDFDTDNWKQLVPALQVSSSNARSINNLSWIGLAQLLLALAGAIVVFLPGSGFNSKQRRQTLIIGVIGGFLLVMQLPFTLPFWQNLPLMPLIQFSWRLMMSVTLLAALLIGFLAEGLRRIVGKMMAGRRFSPEERKADYGRAGVRILGAGLLCLALGYTGLGRVEISFQSPEYNGLYSQKTLRNQVEHGDPFYLPVWAKSAEAITNDPAKYDNAYLLSNNTRLPDPVAFTRTGTNEYHIEAELKEAGTLVIPIFYFDGWTLTSEGHTLPVSYNTPDGFITAQLPAGKQVLELQLKNTAWQSLGDFLSLLTLLGLGIFYVLSRARAGRKIGPPQVKEKVKPI